MSNEFDDKKNPLSSVSYRLLYQTLKQHLPSLKAVRKEGNLLFAHNLVPLCHQMVEKLQPKLRDQFFSALDMDETAVSRNFVTLQFSNKEREHQDLSELMQEMEAFVAAQGLAAPMTDPLETLLPPRVPEAETKAPFSLRMPSQTRRAAFGKLAYNDFDNPKDKTILRQDTAKISYRSDGMMRAIQQSLIRHFEQDGSLSPEMKALVTEQIESEGILADTIYEFIQTNQFAAVKRSSGFLYLDYLLHHMHPSFVAKHQEELSWLRRYVDRYERLETLCMEFLRDVRYPPAEIFGQTRDVLNRFRNENVYEFLPFIGKFSPIMVGTRAEGRHVEQYGVSLKMNGEVQNAEFMDGQGEPSYTYLTKKLIRHVKNGASPGYFSNDREAMEAFWHSSIRIILFKYFLLHLDQEDYDPEQVLREDLDRLISYDAGPSRKEARDWYENLAKTFFYDPEYHRGYIEKRLDRLRVVLQKGLDPHLNHLGSHVTSGSYTRRLTFLKSILSPSLFSHDRTSVLKNELATHNYKYTVLVPDMMDDSLFSFSYDIEFATTFLCSTAEEESTEFRFQVPPDAKALSVLFLPMNEVPAGGAPYPPQVLAFTRSCTDTHKICIPYPTRDVYPDGSAEQFLFLFFYKMLVYLFLEVHTRPLPQRGETHLFFWQFHERKNAKEEFSRAESHIRQFRRELQFLFGDTFRTGTQGFDLGTGNLYKKQNAHSSMYVNVPKMFRLDVPIHLEKIAIVVVTSMKSDTRFQSSQYRTGLFGEVYTVDSRHHHSLFRLKRTFFDHSDETIYQKSAGLESVMQDLSNEGYKDVIYIAKTPYTTKFLDKKYAQKELYFMNEELIESLVRNRSLSLYPMHFNVTRVYEARSPEKGGKVGLFVDDTSRIQKHLYTEHEGIVPIFQLYSGNGLKGNAGRHVYNSLITYQTLSRLYDDSVLNAKIQAAVVDPEGIKPDLIRALLLLHTSRYEANYNITIKIDPYQRLLGDDGVAKRSVVPIQAGRYKTVHMNMLAYFSYLRAKVFREQEVPAGGGRRE